MAKNGDVKMESNNESVMLRVNKNFKKRVEDFIDLFLEKKGIQLSTAQATKMIDDKIEKQGGLKVD